MSTKLEMVSCHCCQSRVAKHASIKKLKTLLLLIVIDQKLPVTTNDGKSFGLRILDVSLSQSFVLNRLCITPIIVNVSQGIVLMSKLVIVKERSGGK